MKNTIIVNLYGGPGTGKSTGAAYIFSLLKMNDIDAEYVSEFAKDKVWEGNSEVFKCQFYITGKQTYRIARCFGKVDVIVTDSPIRLGKIYADRIGLTRLGLACVEAADQFNLHTIDIFLKRVKPYNPNGRNQSEDESKEIDTDILDMLNEQKVPYYTFNGDRDGYNEICELIMDKLPSK
jgi:adenylate kinase family enzyme